MNKNELIAIKDFLDEQLVRFNSTSFVGPDPISIPHRYSRKEDIEIAGFLAATIAWGNRKGILRSASRLMDLMDNSPFDFVCDHRKKDLKRFEGFVHRTFNHYDCGFFLGSLKEIYKNKGGMEHLFGTGEGLKMKIENFRNVFLEPNHLDRVEKHISSPLKGSSAKRICMFLRWMVRKDKSGVDFGIWENIRPAELMLPLDVHTGNVSRQLGLLKRKQNDWRAVEEISAVLRTFDPNDPVKYDLALFGAGINKII